MQRAIRPNVTAGMALALTGAGVIAVAPAAPPLTGPQMPDIQLSAAGDVLDTWQDIFRTAQANATAILDDWNVAPFPVLQQVLANQIGYVEDLVQNPGDIGNVFDEIQANVQAALAAPIAADPGSMDIIHQSIFSLLPFFLGDNAEQLQPILDFAASPLSGVLLGAIGPMIGPGLALNDSITDISDALSGATPDWTTAFNDLVNIPAAMTNALLNGGEDVDLSALLSLVPADLLPDNITIDELDLTLPGLLSQGTSLFNALGLVIGLDGVPLGIAAGDAPGELGSLVDVAQAIAEALGWDGTGMPLDVVSGIVGLL